MHLLFIFIVTLEETFSACLKFTIESSPYFFANALAECDLEAYIFLIAELSLKHESFSGCEEEVNSSILFCPVVLARKCNGGKSVGVYDIDEGKIDDSALSMPYL